MKRWMYNTLVCVFAGLFLFSAAMLIWYWIDSKTQNKEFDDLAALVQQARPTAPQPGQSGSPDTPDQPQDPWITINDPETGDPVRVLPELAQLYTMNNDLAGWIRIPGTNIDYPMMQTPDHTDYYLRRNFNKKKATAGCIYAKEECDLALSDNVTIYGHYMRNGSMFAGLGGFKKQAFWEQNKYIQLDTLTSRRTYEIFAVFVTSASRGKGFTYHTFINATDQTHYDEFIAGCKKIALYDTGITPQYGEKLITLSTCDKDLANGRLVVVARLIEEQ